jgi:hypothetical protein
MFTFFSFAKHEPKQQKIISRYFACNVSQNLMISGISLHQQLAAIAAKANAKGISSYE